PRSWSRVSRASARFSGTVPLRAAVSAATRESRRGSLSQVGPRVLLGGEAATGGDRLGSAQPEVGEQRRGGLGERLVAPGPHLHAAVPGMIRGGVHVHLGGRGAVVPVVVGLFDFDVEVVEGGCHGLSLSFLCRSQPTMK